MTSMAQTEIPAVNRIATERWNLWLTQVSAIVRIELRRGLFGKRAILGWMLAAMPVALVLAMVAFPRTARELASADTRTTVWAFLFETLVLRAVVFFGCAWSFMNLFRGEIVDRSLHYSLLSAVRREVLVAGKFVAGVLCAWALYVPATVLGFAMSFTPMDPGPAWKALTVDGGLAAGLGYVLVVALACIGYGAAFMTMGLFFRNPVFPALIVYGWEFINFLLPPILKKVSIVHYLQSLAPVRVSEGPFAIIADPTPWWLAVPGLLVLASALVALSGWKLKRYEIRYGSD